MNKNFKTFFKFKIPTKIFDVITVEEFKKLLNGTNNERNKLILKVLFGTGVRVSELCGLKFDEISLDSNSATVIGKGSKERTISFSSALSADIYRYQLSKSTE